MVLLTVKANANNMCW